MLYYALHAKKERRPSVLQANSLVKSVWLPTDLGVTVAAQRP